MATSIAGFRGRNWTDRFAQISSASVTVERGHSKMAASMVKAVTMHIG